MTALTAISDMVLLAGGLLLAALILLTAAGLLWCASALLWNHARSLYMLSQLLWGFADLKKHGHVLPRPGLKETDLP